MPEKSNARKSASARHVGASSSASANVPQKGRESGLFAFRGGAARLQGADAAREAIQSFFVLRKHHTMAHASNSRIKVGIVGGTGYTGVELLRLLSQHPHVELTAITSRKEDGLPVAEMYPNLRGRVSLAFSTPEKANLSDCDVVFFATPHGVAMAQAETLLAAGTRIIDLAADFRLQDTATFERWYKMPHACPDILAESTYGLVELNREAVSKARVIGNPGCYPTTVLLGLAPLLENGAQLVDTQTLIADCKSGVSGAGRKAEVSTLFSEAGDNFKAYGVAGHRHHPEITEQLDKLAGRTLRLTFLDHMHPV